MSGRTIILSRFRNAFPGNPTMRIMDLRVSSRSTPGSSMFMKIPSITPANTPTIVHTSRGSAWHWQHFPPRTPATASMTCRKFRNQQCTATVNNANALLHEGEGYLNLCLPLEVTPLPHHWTRPRSSARRNVRFSAFCRRREVRKRGNNPSAPYKSLSPIPSVVQCPLTSHRREA